MANLSVLGSDKACFVKILHILHFYIWHNKERQGQNKQDNKHRSKCKMEMVKKKLTDTFITFSPAKTF